MQRRLEEGPFKTNFVSRFDKKEVKNSVEKRHKLSNSEIISNPWQTSLTYLTKTPDLSIHCKLFKAGEYI